VIAGLHNEEGNGGDLAEEKAAKKVLKKTQRAGKKEGAIEREHEGKPAVRRAQSYSRKDYGGKEGNNKSSLTARREAERRTASPSTGERGGWPQTDWVEIKEGSRLVTVVFPKRAQGRKEAAGSQDSTEPRRPTVGAGVENRHIARGKFRTIKKNGHKGIQSIREV